MGKKILIDAKQPEETRVVLLNGNRIEDFDQETTTKLQNKGNIYLARVTRVEPSLQAAFIEYGGNRHGFLAFSEIHPDYYRIPVEDRKALTEEILKAEEQNVKKSETSEKIIKDKKKTKKIEEEDNSSQKELKESEKDKEKIKKLSDSVDDQNDEPETIGGSDETTSFDQTKILKKYKIQEVISKRQILLVQVAKEERGNKGAALTTYISLAGRYCVLMPNTIRGGGVSRKISNLEDRKRLKSIIDEMKMPEGMAVIIRTAGSDRTKSELKKDFSYLQNLWDTIREKTVQSTAPILINEEGNLIKRTIRDLYNNDVNEVLVAGEDGFNTAKDYINQMVPNHSKKVKIFKDSKNSIFQKYNVEKQLDSMNLPSVKLKSGGYIVINQTEALVAIDVNSGRATKERNIEETAFKTNLEAAEEVARQLKLRDLSGLIVIDFIDMEGYKNQNSVEKKLKEAMNSDRARIQIGRISHFGLLELSRQRLRPSVSENYFSSCTVCGGTGTIRSVESSAIRVLRKIEEANLQNEIIEVFVPSKIGMYILNQKRKSINEIEERLNLNILFQFDNHDAELDCRIEKKSPLVTQDDLNIKSEDQKKSENLKNTSKYKKNKRAQWKKQKSGDSLEQENSNLNTAKDLELKNSVKEELNGNQKSKQTIGKKLNSETSDKLNVPKNDEKIETKELPDKNKKSQKSSKKKIASSKKTDKSGKDNTAIKDGSKSNVDTIAKKDIAEPQDKNNKINGKNAKEKKRVSKASQKLDIVNVDNATKEKKGGWWSQSKT